MSRTIAVFGSSTVPQDSPEGRLAERVGRLLAQRGATVMNGGYGGVMEAVSRGAREAGGHVVGVTLDLFRDRSANPHLSEERTTPSLLDRLRTLTEVPDGFLALPGSVGTFTEVFLVWNLLWISARPAAPLVLLENALSPVLDPVRDLLGISPEAYALVQHARDPEQAVALVLGEPG